MNPFRVLVIGAGLVGQQRARALHGLSDDLPVSCAGTVDPSAPANWPNLAAVPPESFDAAVVSVPHDQAATVVHQVLDLGKPVLCEKPFGLTAQQSSDLAAHAKEVEWPSFVGYNYRFLPHVQRLVQACRQGRFGKLRSIDLLLGHGGHPHSAEGWKLDPDRAGGGVLLDPGVHLIDLLLRLDPDLECSFVEASTGFWRTGVDEDAVAVFSHGGLLATVRLSHVRWVNDFRVEVFGGDGYAIAEGRGGNYGTQTLRFGRRWGWQDGHPQRATEHEFRFGTDDVSLRAELDAVVRRWLGVTPFGPIPATPADAARVMGVWEDLHQRVSDQGRVAA